MKATLAQMAEWCGGTVMPASAADLPVTGVSTDTRTICPGELFVAIDGLNQDGHKFVRYAATSGAVAAVVEKEVRDAGALPLVMVEDSLAALGKMANGFRWHPPLIPWIGVTGSNGKTTTRELLTLILGTQWKVRSSLKNWNNFIGLPLSMMSKPDDAEVAIMEMGSNHPGEIAKLREICVPTVAIVTSTGDSHLEGFGNSVAVAHEKADIFGWLPVDGLAVYPADDPHADILAAAVPHKRGTFSVSGVQADLMAENIRMTGKGSFFTVDGVDVHLPLLGRHNIGNCLAAMVVARHMGIDVKTAAGAVAKAAPVAGRLQVVSTPSRLTVINDAYNANPDSVMAALDVLVDLPEGRKIAVLGDMLELGKDSRRLHREIGLAAGMMDLDGLFVTGPESAATAESAQVNAHIVVRHFPSVEALWMTLKDFIRPGDQILVKGSRGMLMERIVNQLLDWFP
jgi:UDP-N-acetylmuramoyl-tripeptide--D-alanyl-D-alanine ligase